MALGFGFNKAKVLAQAEKFVQQGKLPNAIAEYEKIIKEDPTKLAELYGQQGLFNDARVHYMQVADHLLKSGDNQQAARVLQKILELDPENAHTQAKLADLYQKLGRKDEARNIFYRAAETSNAGGPYAAAEEEAG